MAGTVLTTVPERVQARFWSRVEIRGPDECWPWTLSAGSHGYGQVGWTDKATGRGAVLAHRLAFALAVEDIPTGHGSDTPTVDHNLDICTMKICCNPRHLRKLPNRENARDNRQGRKTHCPKGHRYTRANTRTNDRGWRWCRQCQAESNAARVR